MNLLSSSIGVIACNLEQVIFRHCGFSRAGKKTQSAGRIVTLDEYQDKFFFFFFFFSYLFIYSLKEKLLQYNET